MWTFPAMEKISGSFLNAEFQRKLWHFHSLQNLPPFAGVKKVRMDAYLYVYAYK